MDIQFDPAKRLWTLKERGLDFNRTREVFAGRCVTGPSRRQDLTEPRFVTVGTLDGRIVVVVWTPRGAARRVFSMRPASESERKAYSAATGSD